MGVGLCKGQPVLMPGALHRKVAQPPTCRGSRLSGLPLTLSCLLMLTSMFPPPPCSDIDLQGLQPGSLALLHSLDEKLVYGWFKVG